MTYEQFIDELRRLISEGQELLGRGNYADLELANWKHEVLSTYEDAARRWMLPGEYKGRSRGYRALWPNASAGEELEAFCRDMNASLGELNFIVTRFEKFGSPESRTSEPSGRARSAAASSGGTTFHIHAPVGAIQTGAHSTAEVTLHMASLPQLIGALETLRREIAETAALRAHERAQTIEVLDELTRAAQARKSRFTLGGLYTGLCAAIQTVAVAPAAWDAVTVAAKAVGL